MILISWKVALVITLGCASISKASAEEVDSEAHFGQWAAFRDHSECWLAAYPAGHLKSIVTTYVSFFNADADPHFSLATTAAIAQNSAATIAYGTEKIDLKFSEDTAFPSQGDDFRIIGRLLAGEKVSFTFQTLKGETISGSVAVDGFKDAYNHIAKECDFRFNRGLSDEEFVEPS